MVMPKIKARTERACSKCKVIKRLSEFSKHAGTPDGHAYLCKSCSMDHNKKMKFGITPDTYNLLRDINENKCAICGKEERARDRSGKIKNLAVDHSHKYHRIRGLLCSRCNLGLGCFCDDPTLLLSALKYIKRNEKPTPEFSP